MNADKPHPTLSPYLICSPADAVIEFAVQAFGAERLRRFEAQRGEVLHAEFEVGGVVVMIGDCGESWPAKPTHLHLYVDDVDAAYARALAAGAVSAAEPEDKPDGDRRGGVVDPAGNTWWLATPRA